MEKVIIIAEAGVNHNGNVDLAMKLVDSAKSAGADYVKFQAFRAVDLVTEEAKKADYQIVNMGDTSSQFEMLKELELTPDEHLKVKTYCEVVGIGYLSSPFDIKSLEMLIDMGVNPIKIPSGEITNLPMLRRINEKCSEVILSTGMATIGEIEAALLALNKCRVSLLHCSTEYPAPYNELNLKAIDGLKNRFKVPVGYSDHSKGIEAAIAAVALGAVIVEKHFTLDHTLSGPDHLASLEPKELTSMVTAIRHIEMALGDGEKRPMPSELTNRNHVRKSIVASRAIREGEVFDNTNLETKRPGDGLSPMRWDEFIGRVAKRDYKRNEAIIDE